VVVVARGGDDRQDWMDHAHGAEILPLLPRADPWLSAEEAIGPEKTVGRDAALTGSRDRGSFGSVGLGGATHRVKDAG
jgi:hypothetical protein